MGASGKEKTEKETGRRASPGFAIMEALIMVVLFSIGGTAMYLGISTAGRHYIASRSVERMQNMARDTFDALTSDRRTMSEIWSSSAQDGTLPPDVVRRIEARIFKCDRHDFASMSEFYGYDSARQACMLKKIEARLAQNNGSSVGRFVDVKLTFDDGQGIVRSFERTVPFGRVHAKEPLGLPPYDAFGLWHAALSE